MRPKLISLYVRPSIHLLFKNISVIPVGRGACELALAISTQVSHDCAYSKIVYWIQSCWPFTFYTMFSTDYWDIEHTDVKWQKVLETMAQADLWTLIFLKKNVQSRWFVIYHQSEGLLCLRHVLSSCCWPFDIVFDNSPSIFCMKRCKIMLCISHKLDSLITNTSVHQPSLIFIHSPG